MSGNLQNSCETLKSHLRSINYGKIPTFNDFVTYNPAIFLQIIHHMLIDYSSAVYEYIIQKDYELYSKNDYRFMECVYKFLLQEFNLKPAINLKQFFSEGFLESKLNLCISVISVLKSLEAKLEKKAPKPKNPTKSKPLADPTKEDLRTEKITPTTPADRIFQNEQREEDEDLQPREPKKGRVPLAPQCTFIDDEGFDDITPMSHLAVKPVAQNQFEQPDNKENVSRHMNMNYDMQEAPIDKHSMRQPLEEKPVQQAPAKPDQTKEILKMIVNMNDSFMTLTKKFEGFQMNVETWMKNVNAQLTLLETNYKVLKGQVAARNKIAEITE